MGVLKRRGQRKADRILVEGIKREFLDGAQRRAKEAANLASIKFHDGIPITRKTL